jgi:hypothetical protein
MVMPASLKHQRAARIGSEASCFKRLKRSSFAAATTTPSRISAAAESWY